MSGATGWAEGVLGLGRDSRIAQPVPRSRVSHELFGTGCANRILCVADTGRAAQPVAPGSGIEGSGWPVRVGVGQDSSHGQRTRVSRVLNGKATAARGTRPQCLRGENQTKEKA